MPVDIYGELVNNLYQQIWRFQDEKHLTVIVYSQDPDIPKIQKFLNNPLPVECSVCSCVLRDSVSGKHLKHSWHAKTLEAKKLNRETKFK